MDSNFTREFLLVQAVEEADRDGESIAFDDRGIEGQEADQGEAVEARSRRLFGKLEEAHPRKIQAAMGAAASHGWIKFSIVAAALLIGLATKQLGPERRVNVLAFPLFGVLAWNLIVYLASLFGGVFRKKSGPGVTLLRGVIGRFTDRSIQRLEAGKDTALATGLSRFVGKWHSLMADAHVASAKSCLHLAAAALSIGVIAGMYWNGLAFKYLAAWESTFLSADGVHTLFAGLFAPASAVSGLAIPGLEEIGRMELKTGAEGVPAATWIHLFAITVGLFVVLPRLLMAWAAHRKSVTLARAIDYRTVSPDYIGRLLKTREGGNLVARLVPHRMELGSKERDRLRSFVHRLWGGQLWVDFADPISYGEEDEAEFESADYQVLVLNYSATPEDESQGRLVRKFREQLDGRGLVLLEAAPFRERFGGLGEFDRRFRERNDAWEAVLGRSGVGFAILDGELDETRIAAEGVLLKPKGVSTDA